MKRKVSVQEIAKLANVSPATVSNALNNKPGVSEITRNRIKSIAQELGYKKSRERSKHSAIRIIIYKRSGLVVADTPFFAYLIEGLHQQCRAAKLEMLITHITRDEGDFLTQVAEIEQDGVMGYVILATEMLEEDFVLFKDLKQPVVFLDSCFPYENQDFVLINNIQGAYIAVKHLIDEGHKKIGYLQSSVYINNFYEREQGFTQALRNHNLEVDRSLWFRLEPTLDGSYRDMQAILAKGDYKLPTAFFADNDIIAFGAMSALKEFGIRIPQDVSIVGFDDMPYCEISDPKLTTIHVNKQQLGAVAVKRLVEKINNCKTTQKIAVNVDLVKRHSVMKK
ncbi:MAG TPA: LacI family transcriptional regulator [Firmicutes bacterium]|nr:LacI family transcriptional regulator [Bacillota bacterium]